MIRHLYNLATDRYSGCGASLAKGFLYCLSLLYGLLVRTASWLARLHQARFACCVVSVGNISVGGTGKTSLVEYVARFLKDSGRKVAVVSRGYKRPGRPCAQGACAYAVKGDEPAMLEERLGGIPVMVDTDRRRAIKEAIAAYGRDTLVLDDGFQQWGIHKDCEIVTIDAVSAFGNRRLLPAGLLREPLSALRHADIFVITKTNLQPDTAAVRSLLACLNPGGLIVEATHTPQGFYRLGEGGSRQPEFVSLEGRPVALFSGIADPESFETLCLGLGLGVGLSLRFPDHHRFSERDCRAIVEKARNKGISTLVTTEKDAVRLSGLQAASAGTEIFVLRIALRIRAEDEERFRNRLRELCAL